MFYIKGTHRNFKNVVWLEAVPAFIGISVRPHVSVLHAEVFAMDRVEIVRHIFSVNYPDYNWGPVDASASSIPEHMRKVINL